MAYEFLVEDGTGLTNATSYVDVTSADDYANFIGNSDWVGLEVADKERYLQLATMFIDDILIWNGDLLDYTQALNFPREDLIDRNGRSVEGVPDPIKLSTIQLAISSLDHELTMNVVRLKSQGWGSTREEYAGELVEDGAGVLDIKKHLARLGYGNSASIITFQRA